MKFSDFTKNIKNGFDTAKMLKQANDMKKEVFKAKKDCENKQYTKENDFFKIVIKGNYQILNLQINTNLQNITDIKTFQKLLVDNMNDIFHTIQEDQKKAMNLITNGIDLNKIL